MSCSFCILVRLALSLSLFRALSQKKKKKKTLSSSLTCGLDADDDAHPLDVARVQGRPRHGQLLLAHEQRAVEPQHGAKVERPEPALLLLVVARVEPPQALPEPRALVPLPHLLLGQRAQQALELGAAEAQAAGDEVPLLLHRHGQQLEEADRPRRDARDKVREAREGRPGAPEAQAAQVARVAHLGDARGGAVHDAGLGKLGLDQVDHAGRLGALVLFQPVVVGGGGAAVCAAAAALFLSWAPFLVSSSSAGVLGAGIELCTVPTCTAAQSPRARDPNRSDPSVSRASACAGDAQTRNAAREDPSRQSRSTRVSDESR